MPLNPTRHGFPGHNPIFQGGCQRCREGGFLYPDIHAKLADPHLCVRARVGGGGGGFLNWGVGFLAKALQADCHSLPVGFIYCALFALCAHILWRVCVPACWGSNQEIAVPNGREPGSEARTDVAPALTATKP